MLQTVIFGEILFQEELCSHCHNVIGWNEAKIAFSLPLKRRIYCHHCWERVKKRLLRVFERRMTHGNAALKVMSMGEKM